jgi:hypothetical protein
LRWRETGGCDFSLRPNRFKSIVLANPSSQISSQTDLLWSATMQRIASALVVLVFVGWVAFKYLTLADQTAPQRTTNTPNDPTTTVAGSAACDTSLWDHVYNPQRLIVQQKCIAVTGTIMDATHGRRRDGVRREADGDTHGWLQLDPGFENLLSEGNMSDEDGNLVFEIVCEFPVRQTDAITACEAYSNSVNLPPVGSHVRIVGTYVQDNNHARWMEIHPVTSITVIQ